MNILIPILGEGTRFSGQGYILPKPMIRSCGEHLLSKLIQSLRISKNDIVYILYREEFEEFNFKQTIVKTNFYLKNLNFITFNGNTRGAAESILIGCSHMDNERVLILDCDTIYGSDILESTKGFDNAIVYTKNYDQKEIYSYIVYDENKNITDIEEKKKISDNISVGAYLFRNKEYIKKYANLVLNNTNDKECYISNIYKAMIKNQEIIKAIYIDGFNCFGTPEQLKKISSNLHCQLQSKKRFCFDLDNTLVSYPEIAGDYSTVQPIEKNISLLRYLYKTGHYIIIYTARRMRTHGGDVEKIKKDIERITIQKLNEFNIPYNELIFGKPYADFYIDDLAINAFDDIEKQTGFYMLHTEPRSFNNLTTSNNVVEKFSKDISGEKYYYENIPQSIKHLYPKIIKYMDASLVMEKINGIPLSYLYINKALEESVFNKVLENLKLIHDIQPNRNFNCDIYSNYSKKLINRVNDFDFSNYKNFEHIFNDVLNQLNYYESNKLGIPGMIHGDPVFSNILIDYENNTKFIDMRGRLGDDLTVFGDIVYDYAKIYQSIIGYDFILYNKIVDKKQVNKYKNMFQEYIRSNYGKLYFDYIANITKSFIISLIPLHNNSKCCKYFDLIPEC
jgi:capsule biosynthesis phosphatase